GQDAGERERETVLILERDQLRSGLLVRDGSRRVSDDQEHRPQRSEPGGQRADARRWVLDGRDDRGQWVAHGAWSRVPELLRSLHRLDQASHREPEGMWLVVLR